MNEGDFNGCFPQLVGELKPDELFSVPWGHHRLIIDRCKDDDPEKAIFFIRKTIQNNWSRASQYKNDRMKKTGKRG